MPASLPFTSYPSRRASHTARVVVGVRVVVAVMIVVATMGLVAPGAGATTTGTDDQSETTDSPATDDTTTVTVIGNGVTASTALAGAPSPGAAVLLDGQTTLVVASGDDRRLVEYRLSAPADVATAALVGEGATFDVSDRAGDVRAIVAGADDTTIFVATSVGEVHEFARTGSVGSMTFVRTVVLGAGSPIDDLLFSPDGSAVHTLDGSTGTIRSYRLGAPFDLSSVDPLAVATELGLTGVVAIVADATFASVEAVVGGSSPQRVQYQLGVPGTLSTAQIDGAPEAIAGVIGTVVDGLGQSDGSLWLLVDGPESAVATIQVASELAQIPVDDSPRVEVAGVVVVADSVTPAANPSTAASSPSTAAASSVDNTASAANAVVAPSLETTPSLSSPLPGYTGASAGLEREATARTSESFASATWDEVVRGAAEESALPFFDPSGSLFGLPPADEIEAAASTPESAVALGEPVAVLGSEPLNDDRVDPAGLLAALGVIVIALGGAAFVVTRDQRWS